MEQINAAYEYLVSRVPILAQERPEAGIILGSGLGDFCGTLEDAVSVPVRDIPGFPAPTVEGHGGALVFGRRRGKLLAALNGRVHFYEGFSQREIVLPVRVMAKLGIRTLVLTNAAGGVNLDFQPGDLMLIADHINFSGANPLTGPNLDGLGPRFPDMGDVYTKTLREKLKPLAAQAGLKLREGVYVMYAGPNYETPAEIRAFRALGGDAVGMSTVPEAIAARHCGLQVLGVSCITNMAAGILPQPLSHSEVIETAARVKEDFSRLLELMVEVA